MLCTEISLSVCCCCYCSSTTRSLTISFWTGHGDLGFSLSFKKSSIHFLSFPLGKRCPTFPSEEHNNCPTCRYNTYPTPLGCSQTNVSDSASQSLSRASSWHWPGGRSHGKILLLLHRKILLLLHRKNRPRLLKNLPPRLRSLKSILRLPDPPQSLPPPTQELQ
jgi:hypothetical protein